MSRMAIEWNRRKSTASVWATIVMTIFVLCVLFVFIILNLGTNHSFVPQGSSDRLPHAEKLTEDECIPVCDSEGCVLQSKRLLEYLQPASNPCDNFQKSSCGSFTGNNFAERRVSTAMLLSKRIRIKFKNILENLEPIPGSSSDKMKIVYDSCIKPDSETEAVPTLLQILEKFGIKDWPHLTPDFKFENISLAKVMANLLLHNEKGFVEISRREDVGVSEQLEIPYFLQMTVRNDVQQFHDAVYGTSLERAEKRKLQIDRILKYFNLKSETVTKIQEETQAVHREIEHLRRESDEVSSDSKVHVNCSGETGNEWTDLCEVVNLFLDVAKVKEEVSNEYVSIESGKSHYMRNIFPLLRNFSDRAVANYLAIEVVLNHLNDLNLYFRLIYQNGVSEAQRLFGLVSPSDRWQSCVDTISNSMPYALLYEYGKKEFTMDMLHELTNLTDELIHEVAEYYSQQEWVPESIRTVKTEEFRNYTLGRPSMVYFPTDTTVNEFYDGFKSKNGNFLNNVMELRRFKTVEKIRGKLDSYFLDNHNLFAPDATGGGGIIGVGFALLQPPNFSTRTQRIFNLVSFGFIILHEIGHSMFDDRDYPNDHLMRKSRCLMDQVSQYRFELIGKNLDGQQYLWEDVADNVALSITDKIIERYLSEGVEILLPGLPFPTKQLLYIDSALFFCSSSSKRMEEIYSQLDHSPDDVRIYQKVRNSKIFPEAFDCPVGSFMNPADKCLLLSDGGSE